MSILQDIRIALRLRRRNPFFACIAVGFVSVTAGLVCWIPARRAAKLDPMSALRED